MFGLTDLRSQLQDTLGRAYTLESELTGGGMSRVFVATETALGRRVVVKVVPHDSVGEVSIERFKREIMLAARLQHPHIVPVLSAGESNGLPYFTMPYVEGESLRVRLGKGGELPITEGMRILREVGSALASAHDKGIVHRDIKPDNVLLSGGAATVTDFGVAKALSASSNAEDSKFTSMGIALGTPAYMSPEQDIMAIRPGVDTAPMPLVATRFAEVSPELSPDSKWLAYSSNESGRYEIYVVPFPNANAAKWIVSTAGGTEPRWSHRGNELFYRDAAGNVVAAEVRTTPVFSVTRTTILFSATRFGSSEASPQYDVSADDQRFLMLRPLPGSDPDRLIVVENWFEELKAKSRK